MSDAYIVDGVRTPIGSFAGSLSENRPDDLAALLKPRLMPAIDFLIARGALPMVFTMQPAGGPDFAATTIREQERYG